MYGIADAVFADFYEVYHFEMKNAIAKRIRPEWEIILLVRKKTFVHQIYNSKDYCFGR